MASIVCKLVNGVNAQGWQDASETNQSAADCAAGWVVGTGATNHSELQSNAERASSTFTGTTVPDGTLDTSLKDAIRLPCTNGSFASANWTFQFAVRSPVQGGAADGRIRFRLIKANADGSSATEITSAQQQGSLCSNVGSAADVNSSLTVNPGAISLNDGQYVFVQTAWERTGAGGMTTTNIRLRTGSGTTTGTVITTSDFTPNPINGSANITFDAMTATATATVAVVASAAITFAAMTIAPAESSDIGINFRDTAGYVTDGANEVHCASDAYPTLRGGRTFGWNSAVSGADRNSGLDRRLAGINFSGAGPDTFRLDLPVAGSYRVHLALGDAGASHTDNKIVVKDNTTTKFTVGPHPTAGTVSIWDAADVELTATAWPGYQQGVTHSFSSTILTLELTAASNWTLTHLRVVGVDGPHAGVAVAGTANPTFDAMALSGTGTVAGGGGGISGSLNTTFAAMTVTATGLVAVQGSGSVAFAAMTTTATGQVALVGSASITFAAMTVTATAQVPIAGTSTVTFAAMTTTATAQVAIVATSTTTFAAMTVSGSGVVGNPPITGTANITFAAMTTTATGAVQVSASSAITFAPMTAAGTGTVRVGATLASTFAPMTVTAVGSVQTHGSVASAFDAMTVSAAAGVRIAATSSVTFAAMTLVGIGFQGGGLIVPVMKTTVDGTVYAKTIVGSSTQTAETVFGSPDMVKSEIVGIGE